MCMDFIREFVPHYMYDTVVKSGRQHAFTDAKSCRAVFRERVGNGTEIFRLQANASCLQTSEKRARVNVPIPPRLLASRAHVWRTFGLLVLF